MLKTLGLCFLALTLAAGTAHAQALFLEKGQPGIGATAGAAVIGTGWSASIVPSYTYRGVFDVGLALSRYSYSTGDANHLAAIGLMPFANVHFVRAEDGLLPVSLSGTLGFERRIFTGNNEAPNPDGWGLLLGASVYRRFDFGNTFSGIPELFLAYDLQAIAWHSTVIPPAAASAASPGQKTDFDHKPRLLLRANMGFRGEKTVYTVVPYVGYQAGFAVGANLGAIF